jgi:hypothetical protein
MSGVDSLSVARCTFTNSSVPEWAHSPDAGGICLNGLRLGYTAGDAVFAEKFSVATFSGSRSFHIAAHFPHLHIRSACELKSHKLQHTWHPILYVRTRFHLQL